ncbi:MAG: Holliday junction branch migration protein RuvA, partial [Patescibacteria group bacterium]
MISFLRGQILEKMNGSIILLVNNIGYKVYIGDSLYNTLSRGGELEIYTYQNIKEDSSDLYGFKSLEELDLFEMLLSVSGVGPKSALGVLSISKISDIKESIVKGDSALLVKVSGIGKKTAERLVLELKDKLLKRGSYDLNSASSSIGDDIEALLALGYSL